MQLGLYFRDGTVPAVTAPSLQREVLKPLADILKLEGWSLTENASLGFVATKGNLEKAIAVRPSLRGFEADPPHWDNAIIFTEYELEKDLPACLLKVS
jgi:hypothetical protein